jgi:hypothetical protein
MALTLEYPRMFPPPYYLWGAAMFVFSLAYTHYYRNELPRVRLPFWQWSAALSKAYDKFLLGLLLWTVAVCILLAALLVSIFAYLPR